MPLTYQKFRDSIVDSLGKEKIARAARARIVNLVIGSWNFGGQEPTAESIESLAERPKFSNAMRRYAESAIETMRQVIATDATLVKDIWNFSEIAHDIEEQRNVESNRNRRLVFITDGYQELPEFGSSDTSAD